MTYINRQYVLDALTKGVIVPVDVYTEGIMQGLDFAIKVVKGIEASDVDLPKARDEECQEY